MTNAICFVVLTIIVEIFSIPNNRFLNPQGNDTVVVESVIREVRAAVPKDLKDLVEAGAKVAFIKTYDDGGNDGDGNERGYYKRTADKGNDGYKHFDSFHKKDADKYGYETHSAFGKYAQDENEAGGKKGKIVQEHDESGEQQQEGGEADETKHKYQVVENIDDDEGDSNQYTSGSDDGGHYTEGGESESYGDAESQVDGGSEHYEEGSDGGDESAANEGDHLPYSYDGDEGESAPYTADDDSDY